MKLWGKLLSVLTAGSMCGAIIRFLWVGAQPLGEWLNLIRQDYASWIGIGTTAVLLALLIPYLNKWGWKVDRTKQKIMDEVQGLQKERQKSDAAWEHFKGVFDYTEVGFEGKVLARYDLAQDKQAYNYTHPLAGFSSSPSCSICGVPFVPSSYHGQMGWGIGYRCPNCREKVTEKPIQEFNNLARAAFEATHKRFIRSYGAQNRSS